MCSDTHLVVGSHRLKMAKFATFVALFVIHVAAFYYDIWWLSSLVATLGGICPVELSFELVGLPKFLALFASGHISAQTALWRGAT